MLYKKEREQLADIVKKMFNRYETNTAGGNVSARVSDQHIVMSPTLMSQRWHCDISPYQVLVVDMETEKIVEGDGAITREINMHMACYRHNREIGAVVHGHSLYSMVFATMGMDMPNLTEASQKFGVIKCLDFAPATSQELADTVATYLRENVKDQVTNTLLLNRHGVLVTDKNLERAYDNLGRLEYNAYIAEKALLFDKLGIMKLENKDYNYNVHE
ncbi:class II aldolase/adducin family protein [Fervidibacillus albus]|uniref:Class II aldolase/adducin family protein n=1 Tax=Fervidibacillus albus TaxID=2980026 RepID=A0A9E8LTE8_9BACI|nr:class II aldolase/adducin family protein [Fervidibacillus albus]WAA09297.1 class II aldolase/adducin family protein [Fervidibacillus albus]